MCTFSSFVEGGIVFSFSNDSGEVHAISLGEKKVQRAKKKTAPSKHAQHTQLEIEITRLPWQYKQP